jgi:hypothetical protein
MHASAGDVSGNNVPVTGGTTMAQALSTATAGNADSNPHGTSHAGAMDTAYAQFGHDMGHSHFGHMWG